MQHLDLAGQRGFPGVAVKYGTLLLTGTVIAA